MKTHFDPYGSIDEDIEVNQAPCGTIIKEFYSCTSIWDHVDCKRCLKQKERLQNGFIKTEEIIIEQMGDMAKFNYTPTHGDSEGSDVLLRP